MALKPGMYYGSYHYIRVYSNGSEIPRVRPRTVRKGVHFSGKCRVLIGALQIAFFPVFGIIEILICLTCLGLEVMVQMLQIIL